jgi:hypothetical protein
MELTARLWRDVHMWLNLEVMHHAVLCFGLKSL